MIDHAIATWIVAVLGHSLWQGAVAVAAAVLLGRILPAAWRHLAAQAACVGLLIAVIVTAAAERPVAIDVPVAMPTPTADAAPPVALASAVDAAPPPVQAPPATADAPWQAWIAMTWMAGALLMALWHAGGWWRLMRIRSASMPLPPAVAALADACLARCRLHGRVAVRMTRRLAVPAVIGWWRPAVLIPAALIGLAPAQLEALILHELAHVRRRDWLLNAAVCAIETILFFHPAVWWLGRRIRAERETACDAAAVRHGADPVAFARALLALAESAQPGRAALAATGGDLVERVSRLLGAERPRPRLPAIIAGLLIASMLAAACARTATADGDESPLPIGPVIADGAPGLGRAPAHPDTQVRISIRVIIMPKTLRSRLGLPGPGQAGTIDAAHRSLLMARIEGLPDADVLDAPEMTGSHGQLIHAAFVRETTYRTDIVDGHPVMTAVRTGRICEARGEARDAAAVLDSFAWQETQVVGVRTFDVLDSPAHVRRTVEEPVVRTTRISSPARVRIAAGQSLVIAATPPTYQDVASPARVRMIPQAGRGAAGGREGVGIPIDETVDIVAVVTPEIVKATGAATGADAAPADFPAPRLGLMPPTTAQAAGVAVEPNRENSIGERPDRERHSERTMNSTDGSPLAMARAQRTVDLDVVRAPLAAAVAMLAEQIGVPWWIADADEAIHPVTIAARGRPLVDVLAELDRQTPLSPVLTSTRLEFQRSSYLPPSTAPSVEGVSVAVATPRSLSFSEALAVAGHPERIATSQGAATASGIHVVIQQVRTQGAAATAGMPSIGSATPAIFILPPATADTRPATAAGLGLNDVPRLAIPPLPRAAMIEARNAGRLIAVTATAMLVDGAEAAAAGLGAGGAVVADAARADGWLRQLGARHADRPQSGMSHPGEPIRFMHMNQQAYRIDGGTQILSYGTMVDVGCWIERDVARIVALRTRGVSLLHWEQRGAGADGADERMPVVAIYDAALAQPTDLAPGQTLALVQPGPQRIAYADGAPADAPADGRVLVVLLTAQVVQQQPASRIDADAAGRVAIRQRIAVKPWATIIEAAGDIAAQIGLAGIGTEGDASDHPEWLLPAAAIPAGATAEEALNALVRPTLLSVRIADGRCWIADAGPPEAETAIARCYDVRDLLAADRLPPGWRVGQGTSSDRELRDAFTARFLAATAGMPWSDGHTCQVRDDGVLLITQTASNQRRCAAMLAALRSQRLDRIRIIPAMVRLDPAPGADASADILCGPGIATASRVPDLAAPAAIDVPDGEQATWSHAASSLPADHPLRGRAISITCIASVDGKYVTASIAITRQAGDLLRHRRVSVSVPDGGDFVIQLGDGLGLRLALARSQLR